MWIGLSITYLICISTLFIFIFHYHKNIARYLGKWSNIGVFEISINLVTRAFLNQTSPSIPRNVTVQIMVGLILLEALFISNIYMSGFSSIMTIPRYEHAIKTVQELADSGLKWGATSDAWILSIMGAPEERYRTVVKNFIITNKEKLRVFSKQHFGYSVERLPHGHYAIGPYIAEDVIQDYRLLQEDLYWDQCVFMLRKSSILLPSLDQLILRVQQSGLLAYWESQVVERHMNMVIQRALRYFSYHFTDHTVAPLKWTHVEGAFGILGIGCTMAAICFCTELIVFRRDQ